MNWFAIGMLLLAAVLEVGGDALIQKGMRGNGLTWVCAGVVALGCYGIFVNTVSREFAKLMGVYVAVFALIGVLFGGLLFGETISRTTWLGLVLIVVGGLVIQFGNAR